MQRNVIADDEAHFFAENGYLILRGAVDAEELRSVRSAMDDLTALGASKKPDDDPDFAYGTGHLSGTHVLRRIEYVVDKRDEMQVLLANPFILRTVERLTGPDLFPTWDAMVLKMPGEGILVPWHRDAGTGHVGDNPIFNVDFYLDTADEETCVWVLPGSHLWPTDEAVAWLEQRAKRDRTTADFQASGAVPALMEPGDVLLHNILLIHGSPENTTAKMRRVVYYEFRTAHVEAELGPHVPEYIPLKQRVLLACIERRRKAGHVPADEVAYAYRPPAPFDTVTLAPGEEPPTYRYPHSDYWRR